MHRATRRPDPHLPTERLVLRPLAEADLEAVVAEVNDFAVSRMLARVPYPYGPSDAEAFLASVRQEEADDFSLMVTEGGTVIGGIGLTRIATDCEFGYWLGRAHWGKGYATEAGWAFLAHAFAAFPIERITSGAFTENRASLRVQAKLGFVEAGRRLVESLARGRKVDHIDTVLTRARFEEMAR